MQNLAPIALFVYNRPHHTQQAIEALQKNTLAAESDLYIFSDGAKPDSEEKVTEVRALLKNITGFNAVTVIEREKNYGLANSVIDGVNKLTGEYGRVIVLEDDVICSKYLLNYFNEALNRYQDKEEVMHIGAFMYPINPKNLPETFFVKFITSQAWATWNRAWKYFEPDIDKLISQFDEQKKYTFQLEGCMNFWKQIEDFKKGRNSSWAIRWYASVFLRGGLGLQTPQSLIDNIGHDGSGVHSEKSNMFAVEVNHNPVTFFTDDFSENKEARERVKYFLKHRKGNLLKRGVRFLRNHILKI